VDRSTDRRVGGAGDVAWASCAGPLAVARLAVLRHAANASVVTQSPIASTTTIQTKKNRWKPMSGSR